MEMLGLTLPELMEFKATWLAPVDAEILTGELGQYLIDSQWSGLAPG